MDIQNSPRSTAAGIICLVLIFLVACRMLFDPLRSVPGPLQTRFTRLWEVFAVSRNNFQKVEVDLHRRYGPVVRLAPNRYSISDLNAVKQIYTHGSKFIKSPFYSAFGNPHADLRDLFSEQNVAKHAQKRRRVAKLYSMTTLLSYEAFVDASNTELVQKLRGFTMQGRAICIPTWMQFYAFDTVIAITVGESFGFMRTERDEGRILRSIHETMGYGALIGLMPGLHPWLAWLARIARQRIPFDNILEYLHLQINKRKMYSGSSDTGNDFLSKVLALREEEKIFDHDVITTLGANVAAGSDTTAISLSSVIYHLAHHLEAKEKLRDEIMEFARQGRISDPVTFTEGQGMPYLQAVIKEALRVHPATGQMLSRVVPAEGANLAGFFFPGGSVVGVNPWVTHLDTSVFGSDAASFNPDRWFGDKESVAAMDRNLLTFGAGARSCIGKNISLLEMNKLIPQLYRQFDFKIEGGKEWDLETVWFVKQKFNCTIELSVIA